MNASQTTLVEHQRFREIRCFPCGATWIEQWVGVRLVFGGHVLGSLCPSCLAKQPQETARKLRDIQAIRTTGVLQDLASALSALPEWPTGLSDLVATERKWAMHFLPLLSDAGLNNLVDNRYQSVR